MMIYVLDRKENAMEIKENAGYPLLMTIGSIFSSRPASLCHGPLSICVLTFSFNIFSETTYWILMKFHRNVPALVLFRIPCKNLIPLNTLVAMSTKLRNFLKSLKIFLSETVRLRATKFGM